MDGNFSQEPTSKHGWNYKIVRYFLNNPQLTLLMFLTLLITGTGAFFQLRVEGFPEIKIPIAIVTTVVPGAGPDTVHNTVTEPLDNAFQDLRGLTETSTISQPNVSLVILSFEDDIDINLAVQDARTKAASVKLPEGSQEPNIIVPAIGSAPFFVAVSGGTDLLSLRAEANKLHTRLLAIDGVKSFSEISGIEEKIYIDLPPQYLQPQILEQISSANIGFPLGEATVDGKRIPVVGKSSLHSLEDVRAIKINLINESRQVMLADIAQVYLGVDYGNRVHRVGFLDKQENKFKIQPSILFEVRLDKDADLLKLDEKIKTVVEEVEKESGQTDFAVVFNQAEQAQRQVDEVVIGAIGGKWDTDNPLGYAGLLFGGVWLLMLGLLLFLDWRTALISVLALPLSFLFTFLVLYVMGIQLNTLVLFSLVLVLGLIVDPAIVVLESIRRYVDIGHRGKEAVLRSSDVIGLGLFVAVLTSMIVFIPFAVVSGTFGQIISIIPWTVLPALIASYFVPLIFLTWLGARFIKPENNVDMRDEDDVQTLWPTAQLFIRINQYILQRRTVQILVVVLGLVVPIVVSVFLFATDRVRQVQFSQPDDLEYIQLSIPRPSNQTYRDLLIQATDVENIIKKQVSDINTFFYQDLDGSVKEQSSFSVFIELKPVTDRKRKSSVIAEALKVDLQAKFGERAQAGELGAGPPTGTLPVSVNIFENDPNKLELASIKIAQELKNYSEIDLVVTDFQTQSSELVVEVDVNKATERGLNAPIIFGQIAGLLGERTLYRVEATSVVLRVPADVKPTTKEALLSSLVIGTGGPVQLTEVVNINESKVPSAIRSLNGERFAQVGATVKDGRDIINVQRRITEWAQSNTAELGVNDRAFEMRAGVNEFEKSFQELFLAIFLSILVSYMIFVIFFKSFAQPFIILFAIPLILIGVFPALALFGRGQFGFLETIGILMVIGIAENVGIFLIDYANRKVKMGMDKVQAITLASGIRLRPIILTKVTALAGLLPLAVFSPFWRGLSLVVIFGILSSGVLSLFTTPVLYVWFTRVKKSTNDQPVMTPPIELGYAHRFNEPTNLPPNLPI